MLPWWDIPLLIGLGLLAGGLAGLLGIGGGLIFAPLLLWLDLPPHQALATSSFAIVPTALAGLVSHLRSGSLPVRTGSDPLRRWDTRPARAVGTIAKLLVAKA